MMLGSKVFDPMIPTDFFALHALEILKIFEIRSFFYEKWLLSHVLRVPKVFSVTTTEQREGLVIPSGFQLQRWKDFP